MTIPNSALHAMCFGMSHGPELMLNGPDFTEVVSNMPEGAVDPKDQAQIEMNPNVFCESAPGQNP